MAGPSHRDLLDIGDEVEWMQYRQHVDITMEDTQYDVQQERIQDHVPIASDDVGMSSHDVDKDTTSLAPAQRSIPEQVEPSHQGPGRLADLGGDVTTSSTPETQGPPWRLWDDGMTEQQDYQVLGMISRASSGRQDLSIDEVLFARLMADVDRFAMEAPGGVNPQVSKELDTNPTLPQTAYSSTQIPQTIYSSTQSDHGRANDTVGAEVPSVPSYIEPHPSSYRLQASQIDGATEYSFMDTSASGSHVFGAFRRTRGTTDVSHEPRSTPSGQVTVQPGQLQHFDHTEDRSDVLSSQVGSFVCPNCETAFAERSGLRHHLDTHTDKAHRYPCDHCDYLARYPKDQQRHMRTHDRPAVSPFPCTKPGCVRGYSRKDNLLRHLRDKHAGSANAQAILADASRTLRRPHRVRKHLSSGSRSHRAVSGTSMTTTSSNAGDQASSSSRPQAPVLLAPTPFYIATSVPSFNSDASTGWEEWPSVTGHGPSNLTPYTTQSSFSNAPDFSGPQ